MERKARGQRKIREGLVVSDKMDKTCVVAVERSCGTRFMAGRSGRRSDSRRTTKTTSAAWAIACG